MHFTDTQVKQLKQHVAKLKPTLAGRFFTRFIPFRKKVVLKNLQQVFGAVLTSAEIQKLCGCFYAHIATSLKENILLRFMSMEKIKARARIKGVEHMLGLIGNEVKGAILISGHFGNWEFAPIAGILNFKEYQGRFFFVRKFISAKWVERLLFKRYYQAGLNVIPKKNALNKVCDTLENNNAVVFVMDQHASVNAKDGIMVDFFGTLAGTYRSPAMIAQYTNVPVLPCRGYRDEHGKHVLEFFAPLKWIQGKNAKETIYLNTKKYNEILEQFVLDHPEQWLWMHKRWKGH